ncbi:hypothetical protein L1887_35060 [Cichorium endivia]|nr:hypothetical protein L1887_35060 [Cichorium endivia]
MTTGVVGDSAWEEAVNRKMDASSSKTTSFFKIDNTSTIATDNTKALEEHPASSPNSIQIPIVSFFHFAFGFQGIVQESKVNINEVLMKNIGESDLNSDSNYSSILLDYNIQIPSSDVVILKSRLKMNF